MAFKLRSVVEEEGQRVIDLHRREVLSTSPQGRPKISANCLAAASLLRAGTMVWLSMIFMGVSLMSSPTRPGNHNAGMGSVTLSMCGDGSHQEAPRVNSLEFARAVPGCRG